ncbi:MAG: hypothetical protein Q4G69_12245 [Planctomycetia bacterium]|nr:hypothetical protein [Planctomycetia bacterium]
MSEKENTVPCIIRFGHFALSTSFAALICGLGAGLVWGIDTFTGNWGFYHYIIYYAAILGTAGLTLAVWIYTYQALTGAALNRDAIDRYTPEGEKFGEKRK